MPIAKNTPARLLTNITSPSTEERLKTVVRQLLAYLPARRDWLNPDIERELRELTAVPVASAPGAVVLAEDAAFDTQIVAEERGYRFTRRELRNAFNSVCDAENWKAPIDKVLALENPEREVALLRQAVIFFAGCVPVIAFTDDSTMTRPMVRVMAVGYYRAVGV